MPTPPDTSSKAGSRSLVVVSILVVVAAMILAGIKFTQGRQNEVQPAQTPATGPAQPAAEKQGSPAPAPIPAAATTPPVEPQTPADGPLREIQEKQKKVQTKMSAIGLMRGIQGFYETYSRLPDFGAPGDESRTDGTVGAQLLIILLGKEEIDNAMQNKKQIRFLSVLETKRRENGGLFYPDGGGLTPEGLYDAWGNAFYVKLDTEYDEEMEDPLNPDSLVRGKVVLIYSSGPDGKVGTEDDIKTW